MRTNQDTEEWWADRAEEVLFGVEREATYAETNEDPLVFEKIEKEYVDTNGVYRKDKLTHLPCDCAGNPIDHPANAVACKCGKIWRKDLVRPCQNCGSLIGNCCSGHDGWCYGCRGAESVKNIVVGAAKVVGYLVFAPLVFFAAVLGDSDEPKKISNE